MASTSLSPVSTVSSLTDSPYLDLDMPLEAPPSSGTSTRSCQKKLDSVTCIPPPKAQSKNGDHDWRVTTATHYAQLQAIMFEHPLPAQSGDKQTSPVNPREMKSEILGRAVAFIQGLLEEQKLLSNCKLRHSTPLLACRLSSDINPIHSLSTPALDSTFLYALTPLSVSSAVSEQETTIQTLRTQQNTASPPVSLTTFIESHSLSSAGSVPRPRLPLNQIGLQGLCAPAAMPGVSSQADHTKEGEQQQLQSNAHWEEGIAQLCMPKGAILPLAPVLPNTNDHGLALSSPQSNQVAITADELQAASIADPTSMDPAFHARSTRRGAKSASMDRIATDKMRTSASMVNVPDIMIPTLPSYLSLQPRYVNSAMYARPIEPPTPAISLHDSTTAPSFLEDSFSATSDGIAPSTSNRISSFGDISPATTDATPHFDANVLAEAKIRNLYGAPVPTISSSRDKPFDSWAQSHLYTGTSHTENWYQSLPNYFEKYSDVYSTAFPSLSSPNTTLEQSKQFLKSSSSKRKASNSVEVKVLTPPIPEPARRLSIVSTPRRGGIAAGSPGSGYEENIPEMETDKVLHLATMPSLKNLRIHTSTIRGRRHQKKVNNLHAINTSTTPITTSNGQNLLSTRDNALGLVSSTENALGLSLDITHQSLRKEENQKAPGESKNRSDVAVALPEKENTAASVVNLPGGADFQPSAAAKMTLQSNSSSFDSSLDSSYSDYMQYMNSLMHLQMSAHAVMNTPNQTPLVYMPISTDEDRFKLARTIVAGSTISNSLHGVQKKQNYYGSYPYPDSSQYSAQMTYQGHSYQNQYPNGPLPYPYASGASMYPASVPYYTGYSIANAPEHQHRVQNITYANLTQQSDAHKRRFGTDGFSPYTYSYAQPPITNTGLNTMQRMQTMSQMGFQSNLNMENIPRFPPTLHQNQQSYIQNQNLNNIASSPYTPINLPTMPTPALNQTSQGLQTSIPGGLDTPSSRNTTEEADHRHPSKKVCTGLA